MEKMNFSVTINAPKEKVWDILWNKETYSQWTAPFGEGSKAETDWKKGSRALFLSASGEGMIAEIAENIPYEYMSIHHLGMIRNGVEDFDNPEVKQWEGAHENYTLKENGNQTILLIDMDITAEYKDYFEKIWPQALEKVKELAEKKI